MRGGTREAVPRHERPLGLLASARATAPLLAAVGTDVAALLCAPGEGLVAAAGVAARTGARLLATSSGRTGTIGERDRSADDLVERLAALGIAPERARRVLVRAEGAGATVTVSDLVGAERHTVGRVRATGRREDGAVGRWSEREFLAGRGAGRSAFDIDGVLCRDPSADEDDGAERYADFLRTAEPLLLPGLPVDRIVTSRLERDRSVTEAWLAAHGVRYRRLEMIDLPSHDERSRPWVAERHKAAALAASGARLFVESDRKQAKRIASLTGRAVLCLTTGEFHPPRWRTRARRRILGPPAGPPTDG
ncbi:MAG: hypothetical protein RLZZ272_1451 [Actinomycetota bacterium]